ncbi:hypothetical protein PUV54_03135 [Hyphococcus flavus]|uniref:Uncharacterized protein n=1 Tax=Hyphococcus flavus TaxID=1866326 RepID=A0AAF0CBZ2_9PROT|nr:hypothetical protein [Hyphococcus flavus]WDI32185.1 hypothetical protein PUV54_03135 [Hyphococcus flavus]
MLLRRVIEHVKTQNWTAVALDFVIVVVGVFIGIQVSNWNDARAERVEERQLLTRLLEETGSLLEIQKYEYSRHLPRIDAMSGIPPLLFDPPPGRDLTEIECRLITISHWLPAPSDELPILEESIATGRFDLISNEDVKAQLRGFALVRNRSRRQYEESINELFRLYSRHPDALWFVRRPIDEVKDMPVWLQRDSTQLARSAGDGYRLWNECDLEQMRHNKAFLGEYADNLSRLNSYVERYEETIAALEDLEEALATELGVPQLSELGGHP